MKARNFSEIRDLFDPQKPLRGSDLIYYVDRGSGLTDKIKWNIESISKPQKIIFPVMRGNGNTTELNKLAEDLKNDFFIVYIDAIETLDPIDIEYVDVLLLTGFKIYEAVKKKVEIPERLVESLENWSKEVVEEVVKEKVIGAEAGINFIFNLFAKILTEVSIRKSLRQVTEPKLSDLIDIINKIIAICEEKLDKKILVIVDSLDRIIDSQRAIDLFCLHSPALTSLNCNTLYVVSIIIKHRLEYLMIIRSFDVDVWLPNVKIFERNGKRAEKGFDFMKKIALNRMEEKLITDEALEYAIEMSGGVVHDFIRIIKESAFEAHKKGKEKIEKDDVENVVIDLRRDYQIILTEHHLNILKKVKDTGKKIDDPAFTELLHALVILPYTNDGEWYAVHSILGQILG